MIILESLEFDEMLSISLFSGRAEFLILSKLVNMHVIIFYGNTRKFSIENLWEHESFLGPLGNFPELFMLILENIFL